MSGAAAPPPPAKGPGTATPPKQVILGYAGPSDAAIAAVTYPPVAKKSPPPPPADTAHLANLPTATQPLLTESREEAPAPKESQAPSGPNHEDVRGVVRGVIMTFCGCFLCLGRVCGSFWKDSASCAKDSRRSCCWSSTNLIVGCLLSLMLAFIILVVASIWSSAYYSAHYAPIEKALKTNVTKLNGTAQQQAKDALKEWQSNPIHSYFPMQVRYWFPLLCGIMAVFFSYIQVPGRITTVNEELLDTPGDEDERRSCLCWLNTLNMLARLSAGGCYILCLSFSWGYYIMAATFIENTHENRHALVPVYSVMLQLFFVTMSITLMLFGKWVSYKDAIRYSREGMPDDDAMEKMG